MNRLILSILRLRAYLRRSRREAPRRHWVGSQAEYDALKSFDALETDTAYWIHNEEINPQHNLEK